jgi:hypothetical protein
MFLTRILPLDTANRDFTGSELLGWGFACHNFMGA